MDLPPAENAVALPFDALYSDSRIYTIDAESRARGLDCQRAGVVREGGQALALMKCPGLKTGDMVVATRLPNLVEGAKIAVAGAGKSAEKTDSEKTVPKPGVPKKADSDSGDS